MNNEERQPHENDSPKNGIRSRLLDIIYKISPQTTKNKRKHKKKSKTEIVIKKTTEEFSNILRFFLNRDTLLLIATMCIAYFTYQQIGISRKVTILSEQTLKTANKAYVTLNNVASREFQDLNDFTVDADFINSGNTPAYNVLIYGNLRIWKKEPIKFPTPPTDTTKSGNMIGSGNAMQITEKFDRLLTKKEKADINRRTRHIYFTGIVIYNDIFGDRHCVEFCTYYHIRKNIFGHCQSHNKPCDDY